LDDGTKIYSHREYITSSDLKNRKYRDSEIINALKSTSWFTRKEAVMKLNESSLSAVTIQLILSKKINDQHKSVREAAAFLIGEKKYYELKDNIVSMIKKYVDEIEENKEAYFYRNYFNSMCMALSKLDPDKKMIDLLIQLFHTYQFGFYTDVKTFLISVENPYVPLQLSKFLVETKRVKCSDFDHKKNRLKENALWKFEHTCEILISYRDDFSKELISDLLLNSNCEELQESIIYDLSALTEKDQLILASID